MISSLPPLLPYTSAVSKNVTPASSAASITAREAGSSMRPPKLLQPSPTTLTSRLVAPSGRVRTRSDYAPCRGRRG
jgi:hypothetical protein